VHRIPALVTLQKLFKDPQYLKKDREDDPDAGFTIIDHEEQNAGYQAAYSRLAASESAPVDPVAHVGDPRELLSTELDRLSKAGAFGGMLSQMVAQAQVA
jgi:exportin-2 (importin alpha re-exporter)